MSLYITAEELAIIYKDAFGEDVSEATLEKAVNDYNGILDNYADNLVDSIIHNINDGIYEEE